MDHSNHSTLPRPSQPEPQLQLEPQSQTEPKPEPQTEPQPVSPGPAEDPHQDQSRYQRMQWLKHPRPESDARKLLGENVKRARLARGLTKSELCRTVGISRPLLDTIEQGRSNLTLLRLAALADALGLDAWELLRPQR